MYYVYELKNQGEVIGVGYTIRPDVRLYEHIKYGGKPSTTTIEVVGCYLTKRLALDEEGRRKIMHGFEWTEKTKGKLTRSITFTEAEQIRKEYTPKVVTQPMLAEKYNTTRAVIRNILSNKYYLEA